MSDLSLSGFGRQSRSFHWILAVPARGAQKNRR
jgi:hypothetical protein